MCDRKRKASTMVRNWQGLYRCPEHNEARQPQDFVRDVKDIMTTPWGQPPNDTYTTYCEINGMSAIPGYAQAGCMIAGRAYLLLGEDGPPFYMLEDGQGNVIEDPATENPILVPLEYPESPVFLQYPGPELFYLTDPQGNIILDPATGKPILVPQE
jgi:hypothetical protein